MSNAACNPGRNAVRNAHRGSSDGPGRSAVVVVDCRYRGEGGAKLKGTDEMQLSQVTKVIGRREALRCAGIGVGAVHQNHDDHRHGRGWESAHDRGASGVKAKR